MFKPCISGLSYRLLEPKGSFEFVDLVSQDVLSRLLRELKLLSWIEGTTCVVRPSRSTLYGGDD